MYTFLAICGKHLSGSPRMGKLGILMSICLFDYCSVTNDPQTCGLQQQPLTISYFVWARKLGMAYLDSYSSKFLMRL